MVMFNSRYTHSRVTYKKHSISLSSYINLSLLSPYNEPLCFLLKQVGHIPKPISSPGVNFNNYLSSII